MKKRTKLAKLLETYYNIYVSIEDETRKPLYRIAKDIDHTGRGKRRGTISDYLKDMYTEQISMPPNLVMKTFENPQRKSYFLRKKNQEMIFHTFKQLSECTDYTLLLSGECNYFVTTKDSTIHFEEFGVDIVKESVLYTPIFTKPQGWKRQFEEAVESIEEFNFIKGYLERKIKGVLDWTDLDFNIFKNMRYNARKKYGEVSKKVGVHQTTVKRHFIDNIVPNCVYAHYFFPKGYKYYNKTFFLISSEYEKSLVNSFCLLPCTTYVYPFEKGIGCIIFHRNINCLMTLMEKLKLKKIIDSVSMFIPLRHD